PKACERRSSDCQEKVGVLSRFRLHARRCPVYNDEHSSGRTDLRRLPHGAVIVGADILPFVDTNSDVWPSAVEGRTTGSPIVEHAVPAGTSRRRRSDAGVNRIRPVTAVAELAR